MTTRAELPVLLQRVIDGHDQTPTAAGQIEGALVELFGDAQPFADAQTISRATVPKEESFFSMQPRWCEF